MKVIFILLFLICCGIAQNILNSEKISQKGETSPKISKLPYKFYAGQIHYSRVPVQYWQHRILMIKAMGLNSLSVYIMWNHHEIRKGQFDFSTENKNLPLFLSLAEKHNMSVLIRPGPYVCAQWDFGGLPVRLYSVPNMTIRANNPQFLSQVKVYFGAIAPIIKQHLRSNENQKGSIFLLQIQNQYGSYGSDVNYIQALRQIWADLDVKCDEYHEDGVSQFPKSHWNGANVGLSGGTKQSDYAFVRSIQKKGIVFGGQIYTGWLTHWGEDWKKTSIQKNIQQFKFLAESNYSFSMYMIHGGTNFGLTAGANAGSGKSDYTADITSYDYDAPINQQGSATAKYYALKQLLSKYVDWEVPNLPPPIKMMEIPRFKVSPLASMLLHIGSPYIYQSPKYFAFQSMELQMNSQGFVVYQATLTKRTYYFKVTIHDFGIILLDNVYVTSLDRSVNSVHDFTIHCQAVSCSLRIIVEAMGHTNYAHQMDKDIKGLFNITDDLGVAFTWNMYTVPIDARLLDWSNFQSKLLYQPTLLKSVINLQNAADTYLDMSQFTKGYLIVNGRNLGRYWNRGPQKRLYCPGVWLKKGANTILVLQLLYDGKQKGITGKLTLQNQKKIIVQN